MQKRGGLVGRERLFYFGDFSRYSPGAAGRQLYTPPVIPCTPAHQDRLHITGSRADHARHDTHARTLNALHRSALYTR